MATIKKLLQSAPRMRNSLPKKAQNGDRVTRWMDEKEYNKYKDSIGATRRDIDPGFSIVPKGYNKNTDKNTDKGFSITPKGYDPNKKVKRIFSKDGELEYYKNGGKVPNGPLIKKKGQFKGSTLKKGGKVKKK